MAELTMHIDPVLPEPDGRSARWNCVLEYRTGLFEDATIGRMLGHFQALLHSIISDPLERLSRLRFSAEIKIQDCGAMNFAEANWN
jgi:non-ribosomal peptide synthetase component F